VVGRTGEAESMNDASLVYSVHLKLCAKG